MDGDKKHREGNNRLNAETQRTQRGAEKKWELNTGLESLPYSF
jgi:hypothetical protein